MDWFFISVIIPTYCRDEQLQDTLVDLLRQNYPKFEILVIDQTPFHSIEAQGYLEKLKTEAKIRWFQVNWASLPKARNYGVCHATGEIILFIDDDVRLQDNFLMAHARNYIKQPEIGAVAGRVLDRMVLEREPEELIIEDFPAEARDPAIGWFYINLAHTVKPQEALTARGCNMSFRRTIFDQYKLRFDENFRGSAVREESDFCLRLRHTGYKIWYDPKAVLTHLATPTGGCHTISSYTFEYQITYYHNHFLMIFKNLTLTQALKFSYHFFYCAVLGKFPYQKSRSLWKILIRLAFYLLGFLSALGTLIKSWSLDLLHH